MSTDRNVPDPDEPEENSINLSSLGDDRGRPFPLEPEERLQQFKTRRARRRTAIAGVGVVAACALGFGVSGLAQGGGGGVKVVPAGSARLIDPRAVLFTQDDLPDRGEPRLQQVMQEDLFWDDCLVAFTDRLDVFTRTFTAPSVVSSVDPSTSSSAEASPEAPQAGDIVWSGVGQERYAADAASTYREVLEGLGSCIQTEVWPDPNADNAENGLGTQQVGVNEVSGAPGADEAKMWRMTYQECRTRTLCIPAEAAVGVARVGGVLVTTITNYNQAPGTPAASEFGQQLFHRAIQRANDAPSIDPADVPTPTRLPQASVAPNPATTVGPDVPAPSRVPRPAPSR